MTAPTTPSPERQPDDAGGGLLPCPFCGGAGALRGYGQGHWGGCSECGMHGPCRSTKPEAINAWNRRTPAPQAQPDARAVEALMAAQSFIADGGLAESEPGASIYRQITQALSAPAADDGWNFNLSEAPEGEQVILATEGGHVGEAIAPVRDDSDDDWFWAGAGFVHKNTPPIAWRPLPAPPPVLHPAAPTDEVGK